jgi:inhibitor of the pro-sigma K processing machinery
MSFLHSVGWGIPAGVLAGMVVLRLFGVPLVALLRTAARVVGGGLVLLVVDALGAAFHFAIGVNLASAAIVGILGLPGLLLLGGLRMLMP